MVARPLSTDAQRRYNSAIRSASTGMDSPSMARRSATSSDTLTPRSAARVLRVAAVAASTSIVCLFMRAAQSIWAHFPTNKRCWEPKAYEDLPFASHRFLPEIRHGLAQHAVDRAALLALERLLELAQPNAHRLQ